MTFASLTMTGQRTDIGIAIPEIVADGATVIARTVPLAIALGVLAMVISFFGIFIVLGSLAFVLIFMSMTISIVEGLSCGRGEIAIGDPEYR